MAQERNLKQCSYFLVRYVPDAAREEFLNVGVFVHSPADDFLDCMFTEDFHRIRRFHAQADTELLSELQEYFEQQIKENESDLEGYIGKMQESFSNLIQVTPPRTCLATDPQAQMQDIFERYVGARVGAQPPQNTRMRIRQRLTDALRRHDVLGLPGFQKPVPAKNWTQEGDPFCFDFGYRPLQVAGKPNGHIKLIHAYSFSRDPDKEVVKALKWTFERVLEKESAELTVGHEDLATPIDPIVGASQSILQDERIRFVPMSRFDEFAESVRKELLM